MAVALAQGGYQVYAVGRNEAALETLRAEQPRITPIAVDVTDREGLEAVIAGLEIDVLINNAGMMPPLGNFADMETADIDATLEVNLSAAIMLTRLIVPQMRERGSGHVLFTGSSAAHAPFANIALYSATKAAIAGFAASLRADLSPYGIRVTEIVPGRVETQLYKDILDAKAAPPCMPENRRAARRCSKDGRGGSRPARLGRCHPLRHHADPSRHAERQQVGDRHERPRGAHRWRRLRPGSTAGAHGG